MKQKTQLLLNKYRLIFKVTMVIFMLSFVKQTEAKPLKQFTPPNDIALEMFALRANGSVNDDFDNPHCSQTDLPDDTQETRYAYGCTAYDGSYEESGVGVNDGRKELYPFISHEIEIGYESEIVNGFQQGYIHNVTSQEMAEGSSLASYTAQAIAARTYAYYQTDGGITRINNSAAKQVYIPFRFDGLGEGASATTKANRKDIVNKAVTLPGALYMTLPGDVEAIRAYFGGDNCTWTEQGYTDDTKTVTLPYLKPIYDPVSAKATPCSNGTYGTSLGGLGSAGASRWGYGHTSEYNNDNLGEAWSVKWGDYPTNLSWQEGVQILTHYYTGIVVRNASGQIVTPSNRWNPLEVDWGGSFNPPEMVVGGTYPVTIDVQNTGVSAWTNTSVFKLSCQWHKPNNTTENCVEKISPGILNPGENKTDVKLDIHPPDHFTPGVYTLSIDMMTGPDFFYNREAGRSWFTLDYVVTIRTPKLTFLPVLLKDFGGSVTPPTLPTSCPATCTRQPSTNLQAGNFSPGAENIWTFKTFSTTGYIPYPMVIRNDKFKAPGNDLGVISFINDDWENKTVIDAAVYQTFNVPDVSGNEKVWIFFEYSYCISTRESGLEEETDDFTVAFRYKDGQGLVQEEVVYTNKNYTDLTYNDCNPEDGDVRTTGQTGWRHVGTSTGGTNNYYTDPIVDDGGQFCVDATEYENDQARIYFISEVNGVDPTNFYVDDVQASACVTE